MRILLIRHGQDEEGYRGGWSERGLIETGIKQSQALAKYMAEFWQPIDHVVSSDLKRAAQTTEQIADKLKVPVVYEPAWREWNNGDLAGMPNELALQLYPGLFAASLAMDEAFPNGESPEQFFRRIRNAFERLTDKILTGELPENVAVVTHGGVVNVIYHLVEEKEWSNKNPSYPAKPTSLHEITYGNEGWKFTARNNLDHLAEFSTNKRQVLDLDLA